MKSKGLKSDYPGGIMANSKCVGVGLHRIETKVRSLSASRIFLILKAT